MAAEILNGLKIADEPSRAQFLTAYKVLKGNNCSMLLTI